MKDSTVGSPGLFFNLSKDMASCEVIETVNWWTIKLNYKLEMFKLMYNVYKNILPDSLCGNNLSNETTATRCEGTR